MNAINTVTPVTTATNTFTTTTTNPTENTDMNTVTTAVQAQAKFKFKQNEQFDGSAINMDNLEHASGGFVANSLVAALSADGTLVQEFDQDVSKTEYYYSTSFDLKLIALMGVQLARVLVWLDIPMTKDAVANATAVWKHFRTLAYANKNTMASFDKSNDLKAFWVHKALKALEMAEKAGLIKETEKDSGLYIRSQKFVGMCVKRSSIAHQTSPITEETRRKERVKTRFTPKKDGTSVEVKKALSFVESNAQMVNKRLLNAIVEVRDHYLHNDMEMPLVIQQQMHVIDGCVALQDEPALFSEYFMDLRGRLYQFSHFGPNPQGADMAKALCYHTVIETTKAGSVAHSIFMDEFLGEVIGKNTEFAKEHVIRWVAANPTRALIQALQTGKMFKKFFTYLDMCQTWVDFEDKGEAVSQLGFGPDAKSSGAQILAILAGDATVAAACGLTSCDENARLADLYLQSADAVDRLAKKDPKWAGLLELTRDEIKTPFMAIQYGGGVAALRYKKFEPVMARIGVPVELRDEFCRDVVIKGIIEALGPKVAALIKSLQNGVANRLKELSVAKGKSVTSFNHRHIDGFQCTKQGEAKVRLTNEYFIINIGGSREDKGVIFGATDEAIGGAKGWKVDSREAGHLQAQNFSHYFPVHFIQGLDSVMARKIALAVEREGLRGYSTIHDQFRVCLNDAEKMMTDVIPSVYEDMFINNNPITKLEQQAGITVHSGNPLAGIDQIVTKEVLYSPNAYYFG